jgi:hypothetical protein
MNQPLQGKLKKQQTLLSPSRSVKALGLQDHVER